MTPPSPAQRLPGLPELSVPCRHEQEVPRIPCTCELRREAATRTPRPRLLLPLEPGPRPESSIPAETELLPFDQYQRYRLVAEVCERITGGAPATVLDLGGRTGLLRRFLPEDRVVLLDRERSDEAGLVLGDGSALPFQDRSFDLVVACDTLEHVPAAGRAAFLAEAMRVARRGVVIAGPFDTPRVAEAEETLRAFLKDGLGVAHRYLDEHKEHGLPDLDATELVLCEKGARTARVGHGNLERWLALQCLSLYLDHEPHLRAVAARMHCFYNRALYGSDHAGPVYRYALVAMHEGEPEPELSDLFEPARLLPADLSPFAGLAAELAAFDRERDVYRAEQQRVERDLHAVLHDLAEHRRVREELAAEVARHREQKTELERDLAGHKEALAAARAELAEQNQVIGEVRADLAGHRTLAAALEQDLAGHRAHASELERDLAGHRAHAIELERDLAGHRALAGTLAQDLAGHRARSADLERDLEGHRAVVLDLRAELAAARDAAGALERELSQQRELAIEGARPRSSFARVEEDAARFGAQALRELERENAALWQRIGELEARPRSADRPAASPAFPRRRDDALTRWKSLWQALAGPRQAS